MGKEWRAVGTGTCKHRVTELTEKKNCLWAQGNSTVIENGSTKSDLIPTEAINYVLLTIREHVDCSLAHGFV